MSLKYLILYNFLIFFNAILLFIFRDNLEIIEDKIKN